jgi:hypothetical protein
MLKLYKKEEDRTLYWETWTSDGIHTVHWGTLGTRGESKELKNKLFVSADKQLAKDIAQMRSIGFKEISLDDHKTIVVEYIIDGMGNSEDLDKRHHLEDGLNELLGWAGLGYCDGGSIGRGTMEVFCPVVDYQIAKSLLEAELPKSPFADYSRIYEF